MHIHERDRWIAERDAIIEQLTSRLREAKYGECATCGQPYERHDSPGGVFYSHFKHPSDDHDATPLGINPKEEVEELPDDLSYEEMYFGERS